MTGTVEDGNGSIASIEVDPQISRTYTASNGKEVTEYSIDMNNPFLEETIYDENTLTYTLTASYRVQGLLQLDRKCIPLMW